MRYKIVAVKASLRMLNKSRARGHKIVWTGNGLFGVKIEKPSNKRNMHMSRQNVKEMSESATGIYESPGGIGELYSDEGMQLTPKEARKTFRDGKYVDIPNAGAGSYRQVFELMGFEDVRAIEQSSSAGDWMFAAKDKDRKNRKWVILEQRNRYPYHGFRYLADRIGFRTVKACISSAIL